MRNNFSTLQLFPFYCSPSVLENREVKILFISTHSGNLDNDNNYKTEKDFIKQPFPSSYRRDQRERKREETHYYSEPYAECFTLSFI